MPEVNYGTINQPTFQLYRSPDLIAVRTRSKRSLRAGPVQPAAAEQIADGQLVAAFPDAGVEVYRVPVSETEPPLAARKQALARDPDVRFAGGVLTDEAGDPVVYTENLFLKFVDQTDPEDCQRLIRDQGLKLARRLDFATNAYFVSLPEGSGERVFALALELLQRPEVEYCHPELVRRRERRAIFPQQWHLKRTSVNGILIDAHAKVEAAHAVTRGEGTVIAIIDDGFDVDHPEFRAPNKIVAPRDMTFTPPHPQAFDPRPKDTDPLAPENHGTACAGVACADGADGASGVAPAARLMPIRFAGGLGSVREAAAFQWAADHGADVISCSWGPRDGRWWDPNDPFHTRRTPLPASTKLAIDYATSRGRGGKGCVVLFAAGNGNESVDNDGYASYEGVIAVAACNDRGKRSVYSDKGSALWCAFPSSDFGFVSEQRPEPLTPGIWTTDRSSRLGYNPGALTSGDTLGNYANDFGGTSSACPGAAGVVALVLSVNPALASSEVKQLLRQACEKIDPGAGQYDSDGHSEHYGYGRLDAALAVELARPTARDRLLVSKTFNLTLPDLQAVDATLDVTETTPIEDVVVHVDVRHSYIGDLVLVLLPPPGKGPEIVLQTRAGGSSHDLKRSFEVASTPALASLRGIEPNGRWILRLSDEAAEDTGTLVQFGLELTLKPGLAPSTSVVASSTSGPHAAAARAVTPSAPLPMVSATSFGALERRALQVEAALDPRLQLAVALAGGGAVRAALSSTDADEVAVVARVTDASAWEALSEVRVGARLGAVGEHILVTGRIPVRRIEAVRRSSIVESLKASQPLRPQLGATTAEINLRPAQLPAAVNGGRGVVIGIVDFGCDFAHQNFRLPNGKTRLLSIWDQSGDATPQSPHGYGRVYSRDEIDDALLAPDAYAALGYGPARDTPMQRGSHGTHVMDIAAGNGRGSGVAGCAPEADLIFVEASSSRLPWNGPQAVGVSFGDSVQLLEAVAYIFERAGDRPCVVNLSLGTNGGPHDGSSLVEQGLDALVRARPNRAIVIAASNSFDDGVHRQLMVPAHGTQDLFWNVPGGGAGHEVEVWLPGAARVAMDLIAPDGTALGVVEPGAQLALGAGSELAIFASNRLHDPNNGDGCIGVFIAAGLPGGRWQLRLHSRSASDLIAHAWIERHDPAQSSFEDADPSHTLGSISCGHETIVVGSYDAHKLALPISFFSSAGPTRDGRQKPEVAAPGHAVLAAHSRTLTQVTTKSGTSMAAPAVTGLVALLLAHAQRHGVSLTSSDIRTAVIQSARANPPSMGSWDARFGNGRVSGAALSLAIPPSPSVAVPEPRTAPPGAPLLATGSPLEGAALPATLVAASLLETASAVAAHDGSPGE